MIWRDMCVIYQQVTVHHTHHIHTTSISHQHHMASLLNDSTPYNAHHENITHITPTSRHITYIWHHTLSHIIRLILCHIHIIPYHAYITHITAIAQSYHPHVKITPLSYNTTPYHVHISLIPPHMTLRAHHIRIRPYYVYIRYIGLISHP